MVCVSFYVICIVELLVSSVICRFQGLSYLHVPDCIRVFFCLFIIIFIFILNYVFIVTFWIFIYYEIWILWNIYCFIWNYGTIELFILWHVWRYSGVLIGYSYQLVLHSQTPPGSHAWVSRHCYPIGCVIKSTHQGICSCSPIVNFLEVTFYHGMVTSVIFLIKK